MNLYEKYKNLSLEDLNKNFINACENGYFEEVKYLLTSPELKKHADIHTNNDLGFCVACENGNLKVVKYLLTSPDLKERVDIHVESDQGFIWACENGHWEVVKYLLTSPDLKEHADVHAANDAGFKMACMDGQLSVVKYLIFDMEIKKTKGIERFLNSELDDENYQQAYAWFKITELKSQLEEELNSDKIINNTKKIKVKL